MSANGKTQYQLPDLPYDYNELEPVFTAEMMQLHHDKHHRGYVTKLNETLEKYHQAEAKKDATKMVELQASIKFNGGGHINHSILWEIMAPVNKGGGVYDKNSPLFKAIEDDFGSFEDFVEKFNEKSTAIQGSGWGWLGFNKQNKHLVISACLNHELLSARGIVPLFCVDVWEHAYYLKYKNERANYIKNIWKVLNWKEIESRYNKAIS